MSKVAMKLALAALKELVAQTEGRYFCMKHDHVALQNARFAIARLREEIANEALDKKAENARELGLDYEPAQQEPAFWLNEQGQLSATKGFAERSSVGQKIIPLYTSPQPAQQEPVAWQDTADKCRLETVPAKGGLLPQRTWVGLTDEEIDRFREANSEGRGANWRFNFKGFAHAIEAKLKEKNT